jgi:DNA-binding MarR family transcriptional regulator
MLHCSETHGKMAGSMGAHTIGRAGRARREDVSATLDALRSIVRALRVNSHAVEQRIGLTGAQLFVLQQLAEAPAGSMNELAERTLTHQSSVSVVVSRLVQRGLVTRSPSSADARRTEIGLSAKGRATLRRAPVTVQSQLVSGLRKLPAARVRSLAASLAQWIRAADLASAKPPLLFFEEPAPKPRRKRARE